MSEIYRLIPMVMAEVPAIPKARKHSQGWTYRGFDDFLTAFRPALQKHGLFIVPEVLGMETSEKKTSNNASMSHVIVTVAYSVFAPDGSMIRSVVIGESWDTSDNASTKALDDAFTSFLTQVFCVPTGEKVGGNSQEGNRRDNPSASQGRPAKTQAATPAPSPAPASPSNVAEIDSAKFFAFQREKGIDFKQAEEIRLEFTTGKQTDWKRAFAKLQELAAIEGGTKPAAALSANHLALQGTVTALLKLGVKQEHITQRIAAICDGVAEIEDLDAAQAAKALSMLQRDLEVKEAAANRTKPAAA